ncbi:hypothetical protein KR067_011706 [Drosophila pandora]|nr:hypothetical protein KR067_011706 [Drosophila pandora]
MYVPSSVPSVCTTGRAASSATVRRQDRIKLDRFKQYLERLKRSVSLIDNRSPRIPSKQLAGFDALPRTARTFLDRTNQNVQMLLNLSRIKRSFGTIGMDSGPSIASRSAMSQMQRRVEEVERENLQLGRRLLNIQQQQRMDWDRHVPSSTSQAAEYGSRIFSNQHCNMDRSAKPLLSLPDLSKIIDKYVGWDLTMPSDSYELTRLLRPRISLHFGMIDGRPLGQVVVQLYTEAAPLVVLQFVRTCLDHRSHEFSVRRIFPNLWMEGYLLMAAKNDPPHPDDPPLLSNPMEFDSRVVSHAQHGFVLSCAKEYCVHGFPGAAVNFSISFKPLRVARGLRVGFGRVVRGDKVIEFMQTQGTKNGKIIKPLVITHCDVL